MLQQRFSGNHEICMTLQNVTAIERMMSDISQLPHKLDKGKCRCQAIIETPRGTRTKFKYDTDSGLFTISKFLPQGFSFPFDFGFIPATVAEDGDPLDLIALMDEPAHVGCLVQVRLLGVIKVEQTEREETTPDARLVGVPIQSFEYANIQTLSDLEEGFTQQLIEFISLYNKNAGKHDKVTGVGGPEDAIDLLEKAAHQFEIRNKKRQ